MVDLPLRCHVEAPLSRRPHSSKLELRILLNAICHQQHLLVRCSNSRWSSAVGVFFESLVVYILSRRIITHRLFKFSTLLSSSMLMKKGHCRMTRCWLTPRLLGRPVTPPWSAFLSPPLLYCHAWRSPL